jgi:hypothetical protein
MNLGEMRRRVQVLLRDEGNTLFEDEDINLSLNRALYDLCEGMRLEAQTDISSVAGTAVYDLPKDANDNPAWVEILGISYNGRPLIYITRSDYLRATRQAGVAGIGEAPTHFYIYGNQFTLLGTPKRVGDTITIDYLKQPAELVQDEDVPEIPERWHDALVYFAVAMALEEDDHPQADKYWYRYETKKREVAGDRNKLVVSRRTGFRHPRWGI